NWEEATPESQGVDSTKLNAAVSYLKSHAGRDGVKELVIIRNGHMIWKGKQLTSASWVETATSPKIPASMPLGHPESHIDGRGVYAYNWWTNGVKPDGKRKWPGATSGTYSASGYNNNDMFVIPEWNMVIVRLGLDQGTDGPITDATYSTFLSKVGRAIMNATPKP
ncbi:hypothetical protein HQ563_12390, partial [bacterium]|nr:hypothetical protein [bacterium]